MNTQIHGIMASPFLTFYITVSSQLATRWDSSEVPINEKLQKFVFPEGVTYNREKGLLLTSKVNSLFAPIPRLNCISESDKNKQGSIAAALSNFVGWAGQMSNFWITDLLRIKDFNMKHIPSNPLSLHRLINP